MNFGNGKQGSNMDEMTWFEKPIAQLKIPALTRDLVGTKRTPDDRPVLTFGDVQACLEAGKDVGLGELVDRVREQLTSERANWERKHIDDLNKLFGEQSAIQDDGRDDGIPEDAGADFQPFDDEPDQPFGNSEQLDSVSWPAAAVLNLPAVCKSPAGEQQPAPAVDREQETRQRKLKCVANWLRTQYTSVEYTADARSVFVSAVRVFPSEDGKAVSSVNQSLWVWTMAQICKWWESANFQVGDTGCSLDDAMTETMPDSRAELETG